MFHAEISMKLIHAISLENCLVAINALFMNISDNWLLKSHWEDLQKLRQGFSLLPFIGSFTEADYYRKQSTFLCCNFDVNDHPSTWPS